MRALAKAYAARDEGLEGSYGDYANIGWPTWLRLRDYKRGALIEERASGSWSNPATGSSGSRYRIHITGAGWVLYEREWARYRPVDCTKLRVMVAIADQVTYDVSENGQKFLVNTQLKTGSTPMSVILNWTANLKNH